MTLYTVVLMNSSMHLEMYSILKLQTSLWNICGFDVKTSFSLCTETQILENIKMCRLTGRAVITIYYKITILLLTNMNSKSIPSVTKGPFGIPKGTKVLRVIKARRPRCVYIGGLLIVTSFAQWVKL